MVPTSLPDLLKPSRPSGKNNNISFRTPCLYKNSRKIVNCLIHPFIQHYCVESYLPSTVGQLYFVVGVVGAPLAGLVGWCFHLAGLAAVETLLTRCSVTFTPYPPHAKREDIWEGMLGCGELHRGGTQDTDLIEGFTKGLFNRFS